MTRRVLPVVMLLAIGWLTSGPSAQGLGDVARREAARRQQVTGGKKYTNEDLPAVADAAPASPAPAAGAGTSASPGGAGEPTPGSAETGTGAAAAPGGDGSTFDPAAAGIKSAEEKRGEQFWRDRAGAVRSAVDQADAKVEGLKRRLDSLEAQLSGGAGTSHVQEREVTLKALEKAQYNAKSMREEWDRLEARATAAKVPAEWLR